ncbi:hypothetical protein C2869_18920 [Saccharobesus litoralis]|uniref:Acid phosphatase n=1 Tax=Saccharobesus litoralis TaxID=2172099 RepID=A0A2S0VVZ7_9ALTE|nr:HAD family acid phosphatase [Saccharobesus litoralis]AWB68353.1 hypothetical protein C2869_18920 [Saccharobesus litoralis]
MRLISLLVTLLSVSFFSTANEKDPRLNAVAWMQNSAEYVALTNQTFKLAAQKLVLATQTPEWTAALEQFDRKGINNLPPAVLLDLDDTVISSMAYYAQLIDSKQSNTNANWERWIKAEKAPLVPGVINFIQSAAQNRVKVVLVSNRYCVSTPQDKCPIKTQTLAMLKRAGLIFDRDDLLFRSEQPDWRRDKSSRRKHLAKRYRILLIVGDDLEDMIPNAAGMPIASRKLYTEQYMSLWGERWFILPNPVYGSWRDVAGSQLHKTIKTYK